MTIKMVVKLKKKIIVAKKIISRNSTNPKLSVSKWLKKLNEAITSIIESGKNKRKKDNMYSIPLQKNSKLAITANTSAMT